MVNTGAAIFAIVLAILLITTFSYLVIKSSASGRVCNVATSSVPSVTGIPFCTVGGIPTNYKYLASIDMVVSPSPTPATQACSGFCPNGLESGTSAQSQCIAGNTTEFNQCLERSFPTGCDGIAYPVAFDGIQPYYAYAVGNSICSETSLF